MEQDLECILALDQGTTSSRAILVDKLGRVIGIEQQEITLYTPQPGWVEQDAKEIVHSQLDVIQKLLSRVKVKIVAIGITNQRETTILWDKTSGEPVGPAIVWQDRRTTDRCIELRAAGHSQYIQQKPGLVIDPYFSATKLEWIFHNNLELHHQAEKGDVLFGTVDSYLIWHLTKTTTTGTQLLVHGSSKLIKN